MRKLKLALEGLAVESFRTAARIEPPGTVRGAEATFDTACQTWESPWCGYQTYELRSCGGTCDCGTGGTGTGATQCDTCLYASCDGYTC